MRATVRLLYAVAVALFLVLTVAFGTLTFYPGPETPRFPAAAAFPRGPAEPTDGQARAQQDFDAQQRTYERERAEHRRNVLLIATVIAAAVIVAGVSATAALDVLRVGFMLGGLFTVLWALAYGAGNADTSALFVAALVVLVLLAALSRRRVRAWLATTFRLGPGDDLLR